jgi:hypothetical protein
MAGLPEAAAGLVHLGPHVSCVSSVAESVAIASAECDRAQRKNGRQEKSEHDQRHDTLIHWADARHRRVS